MDDGAKLKSLSNVYSRRFNLRRFSIPIPPNVRKLFSPLALLFPPFFFSLPLFFNLALLHSNRTLKRFLSFSVNEIGMWACRPLKTNIVQPDVRVCSNRWKCLLIHRLDKYHAFERNCFYSSRVISIISLNGGTREIRDYDIYFPIDISKTLSIYELERVINKVNKTNNSFNRYIEYFSNSLIKIEWRTILERQNLWIFPFLSFLLQHNEQQQRGATRSRQHKNVRRPGASRHGRKRSEEVVRGVRSGASDKHLARQDHRKS